MECLKTNKICSSSNRKCKVCFLDECRRTLDMIDTQERIIKQEQLERLNRYLPERCKNCSFLEVIDIKSMKVKCFYRMKEECILRMKDKVGDNTI